MKDHCIIIIMVSGDMSRVMRRLVFWISDQVRHKPGCSVTEEMVEA